MQSSRHAARHPYRLCIAKLCSRMKRAVYLRNALQAKKKSSAALLHWHYFLPSRSTSRFHTAEGMTTEDRVQIPVGGSYINACVCTNPASNVVVIATHPWGVMGGSMYDPHPVTVCKLFRQAGYSTCRFNFRSGLGRGWGSIEDVKSAADYYTNPEKNDAPGAAGPRATKVLLVGYSYGSLVAMAAASVIPACIGFVGLGR